MRIETTLPQASAQNAPASPNAASAEHQVREAPHVLLGVCGGIAAYKACEILRLLQKQGAHVRVCMTEDALKFVGAPSFATLSGAYVLTSLYNAEDAVPHISLANWADVALVVPATANVMAKLACGIADDALTTTLLALPAQKPLVIAPAMNVHMWQAAATQANVATLRARGALLVQPEEGHLACGDVGEGKLASVETIAQATLEALAAPATPTVTAIPAAPAAPAAPTASSTSAAQPAANPNQTPQLLAGRHIIITAGPTHEAIDPVRFIANASTGKMGFALAEACARAGAAVTLIAGPVTLQTPAGVMRINVTSAAQMHAAALSAFEQADAAICTAAVADYTPAHPADHKLKKGHEELSSIELVRTADILADLAKDKGTRVVVGFAAETNDLISHAQDKLERKGCDLIVANDVSRSESTFGSDTNHVSLLSHEGVEELPTLPKAEVAAELVRRLAILLDARR